MALVTRSVPAWTFEPVLRGGHPVLAKAKMSLRLVARSVGDGNHALSLKGTHFGEDVHGEDITSKDRLKPIYPIEMARARVGGMVDLIMRVGRQGQVEDVAVQQLNMNVVVSDRQLARWRTMLSRSALGAASKWTFDIPVAGKHHSDKDWLAIVSVNYSMSSSDTQIEENYGKWGSYVPGPKQLVPWLDDKRLLSGSADALPADGNPMPDADVRKARAARCSAWVGMRAAIGYFLHSGFGHASDVFAFSFVAVSVAVARAGSGGHVPCQQQLRHHGKTEQPAV